MVARRKKPDSVRGTRFELRLTARERADCEWALKNEGELSLATWLRKLAAERVRSLRLRAAGFGDEPEEETGS